MKILLSFLVLFINLDGYAKPAKKILAANQKRKISQSAWDLSKNVSICLQGLKTSSVQYQDIILKATLEGVTYSPNIEECFLILGAYSISKIHPEKNESEILLKSVLEKKLSVNTLTPRQALGVVHSAIRAEKFSSGIFAKLISVGFFKSLSTQQIESITHL